MECIKLHDNSIYFSPNSSNPIDEFSKYKRSNTCNIYIYCVCLLFTYHAVSNKPISNAHKYLLVYTLLPLIAFLTTLLYIFKIFINLFLKLKYKSSYEGMLESSDAIWATEDISKSVINVVLTIKTLNGTDSFIESMKKSIQKTYFDNSDNYPKLKCTLETFLGYNFLLKSDFNINECISSYNLGKDIYSDDVEKFLTKYSKNNLPRNNRILWEIIFLKTNNNEEIYVLIRISHIIGDGFSLINLFVHTFADQKKYFSVNLPPVEENFYKKLYKNVNILLASPAILFYQNILKSTDQNIFHLAKLSGNKIFVSVTENDEEKLIWAIKRIKRRIPDLTFMDILLTAFSASCDCYFKKKCVTIPQHVTVAVPILGKPPKYDKQLLTNSYSIALLNVPIFIQPNSLLVRLAEVKKQVDILKNSYDYQVNSLLISKFCDLIPSNLLNYLLNMDTFTMTLSNVPGIPKVTILNGNLVSDVVFFTPQRGTAGVGFTVLTYDNRFQLGLCIDEAIISSRSECREILIDVFTNIKRLQKEVFRL